ncbi:LOW QUALITY PROTEIN: hypothetical protein QTO34_007846 [Cnephaeus nilssonii]|uniref:Uncharacterized protein n=1 Tax=Cnephaeus nilssonii TaxID=3371016 RepID=A0AA40LGU5_CNENI|nr:LOW QUALITY PROTEIN: hypothetical protein QTO34_007846 [Eptesicus nilssonii]
MARRPDHATPKTMHLNPSHLRRPHPLVSQQEKSLPSQNLSSVFSYHLSVPVLMRVFGVNGIGNGKLVLISMTSGVVCSNDASHVMSTQHVILDLTQTSANASSQCSILFHCPGRCISQDKSLSLSRPWRTAACSQAAGEKLPSQNILSLSPPHPSMPVLMRMLNSREGALQRRHKAVALTQRQKARKASCSESISSKDKGNDAGRCVSQDNEPQPELPMEAAACIQAAGEKPAFSDHPIAVSTPSEHDRPDEDAKLNSREGALQRRHKAVALTQRQKARKASCSESISSKDKGNDAGRCVSQDNEPQPESPVEAAACIRQQDKSLPSQNILSLSPPHPSMPVLMRMLNSREGALQRRHKAVALTQRQKARKSSCSESISSKDKGNDAGRCVSQDNEPQPESPVEAAACIRQQEKACLLRHPIAVSTPSEHARPDEDAKLNSREGALQRRHKAVALTQRQKARKSSCSESISSKDKGNDAGKKGLLSRMQRPRQMPHLNVLFYSIAQDAASAKTTSLSLSRPWRPQPVFRQQEKACLLRTSYRCLHPIRACRPDEDAKLNSREGALQRRHKAVALTQRQKARKASCSESISSKDKGNDAGRCVSQDNEPQPESPVEAAACMSGSRTKACLLRHPIAVSTPSEHARPDEDAKLNSREGALQRRHKAVALTQRQKARKSSCSESISSKDKGNDAGRCVSQDNEPQPESPVEAEACSQAAGQKPAFSEHPIAVSTPSEHARPDEDAKLNSREGALQRRHKAVALTQRQKARKSSCSESISSKDKGNDAGRCVSQDNEPQPESPVEAEACSQAAGQKPAFSEHPIAVSTPSEHARPDEDAKLNSREGALQRRHKAVALTQRQKARKSSCSESISSKDKGNDAGRCVSQDNEPQPESPVEAEACSQAAGQKPAFSEHPIAVSTPSEHARPDEDAKLNSREGALQRRHKAVALTQRQKARKSSCSESISSKDKGNDAGRCVSQDNEPQPESPVEAEACSQAAGQKPAFSEHPIAVSTPSEHARPDEDAKLNSREGALQRRHKAVALTQRQKARKSSCSESISSKDKGNDAGKKGLLSRMQRTLLSQDNEPQPESPVEAEACSQAAGQKPAFSEHPIAVSTPSEHARPDEDAKLNSREGALQRRHKAVALTQRQKARKSSCSESISSKDKGNDAGRCVSQDNEPQPESPVEAEACSQAAGQKPAFSEHPIAVSTPSEHARPDEDAKLNSREGALQRRHKAVALTQRQKARKSSCSESISSKDKGNDAGRCVSQDNEPQPESPVEAEACSQAAGQKPAFSEHPIAVSTPSEHARPDEDAKLNSREGALQRRHKAVALTQRQKARKSSCSESISSKDKGNDAGRCVSQDNEPQPESPVEAEACSQAAGQKPAFSEHPIAVSTPSEHALPDEDAKLNSREGALQRRHKAVALTQRQKARKSSCSESISSKDKGNDAGRCVSQDNEPQPESPVEAEACSQAAGQKPAFSEHPIAVSTPSEHARPDEDAKLNSREGALQRRHKAVALSQRQKARKASCSESISSKDKGNDAGKKGLLSRMQRSCLVSRHSEQTEDSSDYLHSYIPSHALNKNESFQSPVHGTDLRSMKMYYVRVQLGVAVLFHTKEGLVPPSKKIKMEEMTYLGKVHKDVPFSHMSEKKHLIAREPMLDSRSQEKRGEADRPAQPPAVGGYPSAKKPEWLVALDSGFRCMACCRVFPSLQVLQEHVECGVREGFSCHVFHRAMAHLKYKERMRKKKEKKEGNV